MDCRAKLVLPKSDPLGDFGCQKLSPLANSGPSSTKFGEENWSKDRFWQLEVVCLYLSLERQTHFCKKREGSGKLCILAVFCCTVIFCYISV